MIAIIDYGLGNLFSLQRAFQRLGADAVISGDPETLKRAVRLVLPGVGAFGDGMEGLRSRGLVPVIESYAREGRPLLGICLGMQLLMSESEEFGLHKGLGLIEGRVVRFPEPKAPERYKIPNIGWCRLQAAGSSWKGTILDGVKDRESAYFVHSYRVIPQKSENCLALTRYAGIEYCSVIRHLSVTGTQFHPEKSGPAGLLMLKNFLTLTPLECRP